jgi:hypothetical protein
MKSLRILVVAAMAFLSLSASGAYAQGTGPANQVTIQLMEQNGSGQNGTATLMGTDAGTTRVMLQFSNGTTTAQPAHIHAGSCANLDPKPAFPLTSAVNGASETTVNVSLEDLLAGNYAINVHKSATEASIYTACGDIVNMQLGGGAGPVGMPATGNGDQTFVVLGLIALAATLMGTGLRFVRRKA